MKATRSPAETAKYVIKAKLISSLRDTILANFGLFRRQKKRILGCLQQISFAISY